MAGWAFPAYLFAMSLFVLPIAVMGQQLLPPDANPDLYVLTLPAQSGQNWLAFLVFPAASRRPPPWWWSAPSRWPP